ncbi:trimeric LpxA-like protein [Dipodascopsis tothii]|uniref:trimeric LpxA-like protein n=1 Tax=Dipodascopsis tothii TaxID=44089 RepID=UPI0034CF8D89
MIRFPDSAVVADHISIHGTRAAAAADGAGATAAAAEAGPPVSVGESSVLHPRCKFYVEHGPVVIGSHCIVSELVEITGGGAGGVQIGDYCHIEPKVVITGPCQIGAGTTLRSGCRVGRGAVLGDNCRVNALCVVGDGETVPALTVIFGPDPHQRRQLSGAIADEHVTSGRDVMDKHIDYLKQTLPKYSRMKQAKQTQ